MSIQDIIILGCSSQQPTRKRNHGAYLLRWNEQGLLFDPGEGTQRQFIYANVAPTCINKIFISHFHGDHCLGLSSMLMRLNLDKVKHPIHCFYPASGKIYFDRLRYATIYHETIKVIEHPIDKEGLVYEDQDFKVEAYFLEHGVENLGWRIIEKDKLKFNKHKLIERGVKGPSVRKLQNEGKLTLEDGQIIYLEEVSWYKKGKVFAYIVDTRLCSAASKISYQAHVLMCESTYLDEYRDKAYKHYHLTAKQAANLALESGVKNLILTHFSARYIDTRHLLQEAKEVHPHTFLAEDLRRFSFREDCLKTY